MKDVTGGDIQKFRYCKQKAYDNDIELIVEFEGFVLIRESDHANLGKVPTVEGLFQYLCGYEAGLERGLVDGVDF
jgi:hypothetical protein